MMIVYRVFAAVMLATVLGGCAGATIKQQSAMEWLESEWRSGAR
jgi:hypothetical protein